MDLLSWMDAKKYPFEMLIILVVLFYSTDDRAVK